MTITVRRLQDPAELALCCDIWLAASERGHDFVDAGLWRARYADMRDVYLPNADVHLAYDGPTAVGFAATSGDRLEALFVRPDSWGRGVGAALLTYLLSRHDRLRLAVYAKNKRAGAFYQRFGFAEIDTAVCSHTGESEVHMEWSRPSVARIS